MSNKAASFLKQLITTIVTAIKTKSTMLRTKTGSLRTRLALFSLLHNKKLISSAINHKIHAIMGHDPHHHHHHKSTNHDASTKALVLYKGDRIKSTEASADRDECYIDMYSPSFNESFSYEEGIDGGDEEIVNGTESVIEMVKGTKEGEGGEFSLEAEIDHVADVFIRRFHQQMKLQKLESFKKYQEMIQRGA